MRGRGLARTTGLFGAILTVSLGVACSNNIEGQPIAEPGAPTALPTETPLIPSPATPLPAPDGRTLTPTPQGYVFIEAKSGPTRCQISRDAVGCQATFANPPIQDGQPANGVNVTSAGSMRWTVGNLGNIPAVALDYDTYQAQGWTITATSAGTRFTNDATGHGMFVSVDRVEAF